MVFAAKVLMNSKNVVGKISNILKKLGPGLLFAGLLFECWIPLLGIVKEINVPALPGKGHFPQLQFGKTIELRRPLFKMFQLRRFVAKIHSF